MCFVGWAHASGVAVETLSYRDEVCERNVIVIELTRAVLRLVWPSILLQSALGRVATAAAMERHVRKTAYIIL